MNSESAVKEAIDDRGPITFAEFMEIVLYSPNGYYTSGSPISANGDYFTSPSAHPLFGAMLAIQLREMWRLLGSPDKFQVVEQGAGNGVLAADITDFASNLDAEFGTALRYLAFDVAPPPDQHYQVLPLTELPKDITGCLLSNELLDATPVHRFEVQNGKLLEIFVGHDGAEFIELLQPPSSTEIERRLTPFLNQLSNGYRGEVNLGVKDWAEQQSTILHSGWSLAIDYGFDRPTLYRPERETGSLRTYYQHTLGQNPLRHAGRQDITAHVDFTALDEAMTAAGFTTTGMTTQAAFLSRMGIESTLDQLRASALPRPEKRANEAGIHALVDPEGMGRFAVAAHSRNVGSEGLSGFSDHASDPTDLLPDVPVLKPGRHINLTGPQQGGGYFEVQSLEKLFSDEP